jgi:hypothetical protein
MKDALDGTDDCFIVLKRKFVIHLFFENAKQSEVECLEDVCGTREKSLLSLNVLPVRARFPASCGPDNHL